MDQWVQNPILVLATCYEHVMYAVARFSWSARINIGYKSRNETTHRTNRMDWIDFDSSCTLTTHLRLSLPPFRTSAASPPVPKTLQFLGFFGSHTVRLTACTTLI